MADDTSKLRKALRQAESVYSSPDQAAKLEAEGVFLGDEEEVDREALLAEFEGTEEDTGHSVWVEVSTGDSPAADRGTIEDPLADFVEGQEIGRWVGSGQGSVGDRHFFDVTFEVTDPASAVEQIRAFLVEHFPGVAVKITGSDGTTTAVP